METGIGRKRKNRAKISGLHGAKRRRGGKGRGGGREDGGGGRPTAISPVEIVSVFTSHSVTFWVGGRGLGAVL